MAIPYPTMSGGLTAPGTGAVEQYTPVTVHSNDIHNLAHAQLLENDKAIAAELALPINADTLDGHHWAEIATSDLHPHFTLNAPTNYQAPDGQVIGLSMTIAAAYDGVNVYVPYALAACGCTCVCTCPCPCTCTSPCDCWN